MMRASERERVKERRLGKKLTRVAWCILKRALGARFFCKTVVEKTDARNYHPEARCVLLIAFSIHNIEMKFMHFKVCTLLLYNKATEQIYIYTYIFLCYVRNVYFLMKKNIVSLLQTWHN